MSTNIIQIINGKRVKECYKCKKVKQIRFFHKDKQKKSGLSACCSLCDSKRHKEKYKNDTKYKEKHNRARLKRVYGLTPEEVNDKLVLQNFKCEICGTTLTYERKGFCIDHNHDTGKIRALLCDRCNKFLGSVENNLHLMSNALEYLNKYK